MYRGIRTTHEKDMSKMQTEPTGLSLPGYLCLEVLVGAFGCSPQAHDAAVNNDGPLKPVRLYQDAEGSNAGMSLVPCLCVCHTWESVSKHNS
jgi:hypothetical protein